MNHSIILLIMLLIFSTGLLMAASALQITPREIQMGRFPAKQSRTREIQVLNSGKEKVLISAVRATCSCVKLSYPNEIKPGQTVPIKFHISGNSYNGDFQGKVYIISNAVDSPSEIKFSGHAEPLFVITPKPEQYIGAITSGGNWEQSFSLVADSAEVKFGVPKITAPFPVTTQVKSINGREYTITIKATGIHCPQKQPRFRFSIELPIEKPPGWSAAKFEFQGRIK